MIVVAIIGILAAVALPQYRNYMQRSANGACLAEAKAYMNAGVADAADGRTPAVYYTKPSRACEKGVDMTIAHYTSGATLTFEPKVKGTSTLVKNTTCNAGSGSCEYAP